MQQTSVCVKSSSSFAKKTRWVFLGITRMSEPCLCFCVFVNELTVTSVADNDEEGTSKKSLLDAVDNL